MKDHSSHYFCLLALVIVLIFTPQVFAEVYKTVDENGSVVYTDQPPSPDSIPLIFHGLSVTSTQASELPAHIPDQEVSSILDLRRGYRDFALLSPTQDQSISSTGNEASVTWQTREPLQQGMSVILYVDGVALPATTFPVITVGPLNLGKHNIYAELIDSQNKRIAKTSRVSFHIKQFSVNSP